MTVLYENRLLIDFVLTGTEIVLSKTSYTGILGATDVVQSQMTSFSRQLESIDRSRQWEISEIIIKLTIQRSAVCKWLHIHLSVMRNTFNDSWHNHYYLSPSRTMVTPLRFVYGQLSPTLPLSTVDCTHAPCAVVSTGAKASDHKSNNVVIHVVLSSRLESPTMR